MCLSKVDKVVTLDKDTRVYKVVDVLNDKRVVNLYRNIGIRFTVFHRGLNHAVRGNIRAMDDHQIYVTGFHAYLARRDAAALVRDHSYRTNEPLILTGIIPAGTEVTIGWDGGMQCIVSPVIIIKRFPRTKS
jgi:hypothetical protein